MRRWTILPIGLGLLAFVAVIASGYAMATAWVGVNDPASNTFKTLWDWMELLIVPAALGLAVLWLNKRLTDSDRRQVADKSEEEALQAYLDRMTELLLERNLREARPHSDLQAIAEARTKTTLRRLNPRRKGVLIEFLSATRLIDVKQGESEGLIRLAGVDLSGMELEDGWLLGADLGETMLRRARLGRTVFRGAVLFGADLSGADLSSCNLQLSRLDNAKLVGANLPGAHLQDARLELADFTGADLSGANLTGAFMLGTVFKNAKVTTQQIEAAKDRRGVTMPDGSKLSEAESVNS